MRGVVLAGGTGSRLGENTKVVNKHLLPVYSKPMIYYPIEFLRDSGAKDIMIVLGGNSVGEFVTLLGDGSQLGVSLTYRYQRKADGIAGALKLIRSFVGEEVFAVCLGDNIFSKPLPLLAELADRIAEHPGPSAAICLSETDRASSFGVPTFDAAGNVIKITEKPTIPDSNYAVTGLYLYDRHIWSMIDSLQPSARGELEITDVNNYYINNGKMFSIKLDGLVWHDAGSIESLYAASTLIRNATLQNK